jgi:hypothetical protein
MHELPPDLQRALENYKDPYDRHRNAELLEDWDGLFDVLRELHATYPDWRFGQLITNLALWSGSTELGTTYDVPDERLLETARKHLAKRRAEAAPSSGG